MNSKKPILSISLLSCGRDKTIQKCLDSLKRLMEKVPSELIIVDTGCSDEIKELMSQYTDQIIPFAWCDDFAKARNTGMEAASGEWFLYLDDDEWFMDTKEIEDFFLSGEYKQYGYACYIVRNYTLKNKELYTDSWASRMIRLDKNVRFTGCIHEHFYPISGSYKLLWSYAEHFGYCFESKEEERRHTMRNKKLLLKQMETDKREIRWWVHLLNEYLVLKEYDNIKKLAEEGLAYFKDCNDYPVNRDRGAFYCAIAEADILMGMYEEAILDAQKALEDDRNTLLCNTRLYALLADAYFRLGGYAESRRFCEAYLKGYGMLKNTPELEETQTVFFASHAMEKEGYFSTLCYYILAALKEGDSSALQTYFWEFGWNDILILNTTFMEDVVEEFSRLPYEEVFVKAADTMAKRKGVPAFWNKLHEIEEKYRKAEGEEQERFYRIARIFSQVTVSDYYIWYLKIFYADYIGDSTQLEHDFAQLFHEVADFFCLDRDVFAIVEKYHVEVGKLFEEITFDKWRLGVDSFFARSSYSEIQNRCEFVKNTMPSAPNKNIIRPDQNEDTAQFSEALSLRYDYFFMKMAGLEAAAGKYDVNFEQLQETLRVFADRTLAFYSRFFKETAFEGEMPLLPAECRVAVRFRDLLDAQLAGDKARISECLKKAVGVFPAFDESLKAYARFYAEWEKARLEEEQISPEMRELAGQIKGKVLELLEQNLVIEALQVVQQLKTFTPNDPEIAALEKQISLKLS